MGKFSSRVQVILETRYIAFDVEFSQLKGYLCSARSTKHRQQLTPFSHHIVWAHHFTARHPTRCYPNRDQYSHGTFGGPSGISTWHLYLFEQCCELCLSSVTICF